MNSPGGYVYILSGDDTFGRDEAVPRIDAEQTHPSDAGDVNRVSVEHRPYQHGVRVLRYGGGDQRYVCTASGGLGEETDILPSPPPDFWSAPTPG